MEAKWHRCFFTLACPSLDQPVEDMSCCWGTGRSAHVQQDLRTSVPFQCLNFPFMLQSVSEWESVCYGLLVVLSSFNFLVFMNCPATLHVNDRISSPSNQITVILSRTAHKKHVYKSSLCKYSPHINSMFYSIFPWKKSHLSRWAAPSHGFSSRSRHQLILPNKINRETPVHTWYSWVYLLVFDLI